MHIPPGIVEWIAERMKVSSSAVRMFKAASALSGLGRETLPSELIPLNTIMLSRGLLNFTLLQSLQNWVFPYWVEDQFNPSGRSFIPRSHLGLSINVTRRNWTAVGTPECSTEPIVDQRGLVTPFRNGWSIDTWLTVGEITLFPSRLDHMEQRLIQSLPIVETPLSNENIECLLTTFVDGHRLVHRATVKNLSFTRQQCRLSFAIRPFNPEGVSLLHDLAFDDASGTFSLDEGKVVLFSSSPTAVRCSTFADGDSAKKIGVKERRGERHEVHCDVGLANGFAAFDLELEPGIPDSVTATVPLESPPSIPKAAGPIRDPAEYWDALLSRGTALLTPDEHLNGVVRTSLSTLLLLTDGDTITPGPATYHQFWFRDAAYMVWALDKFGFSSLTRPITGAFAWRQERSGYFRSQQGEWDSNGQVLWTVWQHTILSHDMTAAQDLAKSLFRGVQWIQRVRLTGGEHCTTSHAGLLPRGLSAEHLGLADYYFWDDFWSAAGVQAYLRICDLLGRTKERETAAGILNDLRLAIERAIDHVQRLHSFTVIPASPARSVDSGMVGSCCAWYPLQYLASDDRRMMDTLDVLSRDFFLNGMFYQSFIHSGLNVYLTLHIAHAYLYAGRRTQFIDIFRRALSFATPTNNFPEAINPQTGGGAMGDGHHGWAAAEILLAARDAFVYERWHASGVPHTLELLAGIPPEWCVAQKESRIVNAPIPEGFLSIAVMPGQPTFSVRLLYRKSGVIPPGAWRLRIPFLLDIISAKEGKVLGTTESGNETVIDVIPGDSLIEMTIRR